jgi:hypothetical protein
MNLLLARVKIVDARVKNDYSRVNNDYSRVITVHDRMNRFLAFRINDLPHMIRVHLHQFFMEPS